MVSAILTYGSDKPPTSIFFKFLASSITGEHETYVECSKYLSHRVREAKGERERVIDDAKHVHDKYITV